MSRSRTCGTVHIITKMAVPSLRSPGDGLLRSPEPFAAPTGTGVFVSDTELTGRIRQILKDHAHLESAVDSLSTHADLYEAGMTSHASVNVMLALEGEFEIEFPDHMLKRSMFDSIASIRTAIEELTAAA